MQLVPGDRGVWHLIDETTPSDANRIAVLRGPVEVLTVKGLCEAVELPRIVDSGKAV